MLNQVSDPSAGHDGITAHVVRHAKNFLVEPLTHLINAIIVEGSYPRVLKGARVVPIFKAGQTGETSNYRPVSILPVLNKVFEKLLTAQMTRYLESNDLLSKNQFGFRKKRGTTHALLQLIEETRFELDTGKYCATLPVDLRRAFDSVRSDDKVRSTRFPRQCAATSLVILRG